jgi:hypothetical protein
MTGRFDHLPNRRAIIDRRAVADTIAALDETDPVALGRQATILLKAALDAGRVEVAKRLAEHPSRGLEVSSAQAYLIEAAGHAGPDRAAGAIRHLDCGKPSRTLGLRAGLAKGRR